MKNLSKFSFQEWLSLKPIKFFLKEIRNDIVLAIYKRMSAENECQFISDCKKFKDQKILIVFAFEQPRILEWLLKMAKKNLNEFNLIIFDNSKDISKRIEIKAVCKKYEIPYLGLPYNYTKHPNRSHGMAMTWVFHRIVKKIEPSWFGYLDHDMIPVEQTHFQILEQQDIYGTINQGKDCWNLWAGFCFFKYVKVASLPINFLYDFSRDLDTGGRNWDCLYSKYSQNSIKFADDSRIEFTINDQLKSIVQIIDGSWVHIGGVSYNNNLAPKEIFYENLIKNFQEGRTIQDMQSH